MKTEHITNGSTRLTVTRPWGFYVTAGSRVLCSDGKVRALHRIAETADTFFSIPASIRIGRKIVTGYVTTQEQSWIRGVKEHEPFLCAYTFRQHTEQKHPGLLPPWRSSLDDGENINAMIAACHQ